MAVRIQKQELQECSSSAVDPDESHNLSQVTQETDLTSSTARRCHDHGNLGYDASNENAGGLAADSPSNGLLASLPSTRARASLQTYGDVVPLREEERLLNRDKSEELPLTQAKMRWSSVLVHR